MSDSESSKDCPLCLEAFELDDISFYPCHCGYQICRFCWHRIKNGDSALCPACRQPYPDDPVKFKPMTEDDVQTMKLKKKEKELQRRKRITDNRKHLSQIRVLQKNLVFVVGLPLYLDEAEKLKGCEYFGQFGKVIKVVANNSTAYAGTQAPSLSAYVTYSKMEEALQAVQGVNNVTMDGRTLKASLGTTKYCSTYLKNQQCHKADCMYLHEQADAEASFTKEDMQAQKHQEYERKLMRQMMQRNEEAQNAEIAAAKQESSTLETTTTRCSSAPIVKLSHHHTTSSTNSKKDDLDSVTSSVDCQAWSGGGGTQNNSGEEDKDPFDDSIDPQLELEEHHNNNNHNTDDTTKPPDTPPPDNTHRDTMPPPAVSVTLTTPQQPPDNTEASFMSMFSSDKVTHATTEGRISPSLLTDISSTHPFAHLREDFSEYTSKNHAPSTASHSILNNVGAVGTDGTSFNCQPQNLNSLSHDLGITERDPHHQTIGLPPNTKSRLGGFITSEFNNEHPASSQSQFKRSYDNEILFETMEATTAANSIYGCVGSPSSGMDALSRSRMLGANTTMAAPNISQLQTDDHINMMSHFWQSSTSNSIPNFIGSGRNGGSKTQQQQKHTYNIWPPSNTSATNNKSSSFFHQPPSADTSYINHSMTSQSNKHKDEADLDFDVFAEGNKEFSEITNNFNLMGILDSDTIDRRLPNTAAYQMGGPASHLQGTPAGVASGMIPPPPPTHHIDDYHHHNNPFGDLSRKNEQRNLFKKLLPSSIKVKFTNSPPSANEMQQQQQQPPSALDMTSQQQQPTKSRFAPFMSQQQSNNPMIMKHQMAAAASEQQSSLYSGFGGGWLSQPPPPPQQQQLQISNSIFDHNNGFAQNSSPFAPQKSTNAPAFSPVGPPPGLIGGGVSSSSPYDPAIIASGPSGGAIARPQHHDTLYGGGLPSTQMEEPHWMKSLHSLTDTDGTTTPPAPLQPTNMNNNNAAIMRQQQANFISNWNKMPPTSVDHTNVDPFATSRLHHHQNSSHPPPGFR